MYSSFWPVLVTDIVNRIHYSRLTVTISGGVSPGRFATYGGSPLR
jgi:hypothetical protein